MPCSAIANSYRILRLPTALHAVLSTPLKEGLIHRVPPLWEVRVYFLHRVPPLREVWVYFLRNPTKAVGLCMSCAILRPWYKKGNMLRFGPVVGHHFHALPLQNHEVALPLRSFLRHTWFLWGSPSACRSFVLCACEAKLGPSARYASQYKSVFSFFSTVIFSMTGHFSRYDVDWVVFNPDQ